MSRAPKQKAPSRAGGCLRDAAIVAAVLAALLIAVGAAAYFAFVMADKTLQQEDMANLAESEVRADLLDLRLSTPDLSELAYVSNESLDGPRFDDISIGGIRYGAVKDGKMTPTTRSVTANALWQNTAVSVKRPLTAEFEFVSSAEGWKLSIYTLATMEVSPLRPLNMYDLEPDVIALLRLYDAALADAYAEAPMALSGDPTTEGGTVRAVLTAAGGDAAAECVVNMDVTWSSQHGWVVEVVSASAQGDAPAAPALSAAEPSALAPEPITYGNDGERAQRLDCHEGVLVALSGTLVQRDGIFMLETIPTEVTMQGRSWVLDRFVVTGPSSKLSERLRSEATVNGYLTAGYVLSDAPLSLAMKSVS